MKKSVRTAIILLLFLLLVAGIYYRENFTGYGNWRTINTTNDIHWIRFDWIGAEIGNKWREKAGMTVPVTVQDIPDTFICHFDIGRDVTTINGKVLELYASRSRQINKSLHKPFLLNRREYLSPLQITIDGMAMTSDKVLVDERFGGIDIVDTSKNDRVNIGAIGVDICKDKVLIIDYPHRQFCITKTLPSVYHPVYSDITLDNVGEPILKMDYKGKQYKIMFDCGSSIFPLLVKRQYANDFSDAAIDDTFSFPESGIGGKISYIHGRPMKDSFTLAGYRYGNIEVYSSEKDGIENISNEFDAITGNALFFDKVVIVDFKNRKFGVL